MSLIGISGRKGSGKDTVGKIIQDYYDSDYQIKKFADKLKDIVCLLVGCSREDLESEEFKNSELGEEWNCYLDGFSNRLYLDKDDAIHEAFTEWDADERYIEHRIMTPRLLLQLLGTECGREIIHPQIWVNSTMVDYKKGNWIITDMRFPNELQAVKEREGITIRVNRGKADSSNDLHASETALDEAEFDYVIENNGTIFELKEKVFEILNKL